MQSTYPPMRPDRLGAPHFPDRGSDFRVLRRAFGINKVDLLQELCAIAPGSVTSKRFSSWEASEVSLSADRMTSDRQATWWVALRVCAKAHAAALEESGLPIEALRAINFPLLRWWLFVLDDANATIC
jgi:hypothetical protein